MPDGGDPSGCHRDRPDIRDFHAARFSPAGATLVIAGDLTDVDPADLGRRMFAGWSAAPPRRGAAGAARRRPPPRGRGRPARRRTVGDPGRAPGPAAGDRRLRRDDQHGDGARRDVLLPAQPEAARGARLHLRRLRRFRDAPPRRHLRRARRRTRRAHRPGGCRHPRRDRAHARRRGHRGRARQGPPLPLRRLPDPVLLALRRRRGPRATSWCTTCPTTTSTGCASRSSTPPWRRSTTPPAAGCSPTGC